MRGFVRVRTVTDKKTNSFDVVKLDSLMNSSTSFCVVDIRIPVVTQEDPSRLMIKAKKREVKRCIPPPPGISLLVGSGYRMWVDDIFIGPKRVWVEQTVFERFLNKFRCRASSSVELILEV